MSDKATPTITSIKALKKELRRRILLCEKLQFQAFQVGGQVPNLNAKKLAYKNILGVIS